MFPGPAQLARWKRKATGGRTRALRSIERDARAWAHLFDRLADGAIERGGGTDWPLHDQEVPAVLRAKAARIALHDAETDGSNV